jgi:hypothetical protein
MLAFGISVSILLADRSHGTFLAALVNHANSIIHSELNLQSHNPVSGLEAIFGGAVLQKKTANAPTSRNITGGVVCGRLILARGALYALIIGFPTKVEKANYYSRPFENLSCSLLLPN